MQQQFRFHCHTPRLDSVYCIGRMEPEPHGWIYGK